MKFLLIFSLLPILSPAKAQTAHHATPANDSNAIQEKSVRCDSGDFLAETEDEPYDAAEEMPRFPGGEKALYDWIYKNLNHPPGAQERGIQGTIWVRFVVSKTGKVEQPKVIHGIDPDCDKEALRVVAAIPDWIPGKQNGRNVSVYYTVRIVYKMQR